MGKPNLKREHVPLTCPSIWIVCVWQEFCSKASTSVEIVPKAELHSKTHNWFVQHAIRLKAASIHVYASTQACEGGDVYSGRIYEGGSLFVISGLCSAERMVCNKSHCKWFVKNSRWKSFRRNYYLGQLALSRSEVNEAQHSEFLALKRVTFWSQFWLQFLGLALSFFNGWSQKRLQIWSQKRLQIWGRFWCQNLVLVISFRWAGASSEQDAFFARLLWDLPRKTVSIQLAPPKQQYWNLSLQQLLLLLQHGGAMHKVAWNWGGASTRLPNSISFLKPKVVQS